MFKNTSRNMIFTSVTTKITVSRDIKISFLANVLVNQKNLAAPPKITFLWNAIAYLTI
jgi:hypothetical protein